jgi:hypothetical protein
MHDSPLDWSREQTPRPQAPSCVAGGSGVASSDGVDEEMASAAGGKKPAKRA